MLPGIRQSPFFVLEEHPRGIPVEIIPPGIVPTESDLDDGSIIHNTHHSCLTVHTDVVRIDSRATTQQKQHGKEESTHTYTSK